MVLWGRVHEGGSLMNGISALLRGMREFGTCLCFSLCEVAIEGM